MFRPRRFWRPRPMLWRGRPIRRRVYGMGCTLIAFVIVACIVGMFLLNIFLRSIF